MKLLALPQIVFELRARHDFLKPGLFGEYRNLAVKFLEGEED